MNKSVSGNLSKSSAKYVVTPGLIEYFFSFINHCEAAENAPIMIVGPTGVGKSLFLHIYKKWIENERKPEGKKGPIINWANCAHFGGVNSDPNIARAELFGQKRGASAQAFKDMKGLVAATDGGSLILEEIGELPMEVQAMLLTFIETGQYREVGGTETKYADVRIIGATNREEVLREDFRYRFFPFYLEPLYKRREDVLYYLSYKYPDLIQSLTRNEVLTLLAYNWPGNVREIDRVARMIYRDKISYRFDDPEVGKLGRFDRLDKRVSQIRSDLAPSLDDISFYGGDSELLESLLNKFGVGLSNENPEPAFKNYQFQFDKQYKKNKFLKKIEKVYEVKLLPGIKEFEDSHRGYLAYCGLFMQDPSKNANVLDDPKSEGFSYLSLERLDYPEDKKSKVIRLAKAVMQCFAHIQVSEQVMKYAMPTDLEGFWIELNKDIEEIKGREKCQNVDEFKETEKNTGISPIFHMSEVELLKMYYSGLLKKTGGKVKSASQLAQVKETTFRSRLDKFGISYKKADLKKKKTK